MRIYRFSEQSKISILLFLLLTMCLHVSGDVHVTMSACALSQWTWSFGAAMLDSCLLPEIGARKWARVLCNSNKHS